ncbi:MAG TPA: hypothetical protein IAB38_06405 [Candidatus Onthousia excrementipullorum]|uniref:SGNH hydrolase-type esterase domain-containing protein n=1 Tax=Candidatus Onthousia excrementipullorum TaxID=2840884 RepID=A0A9D1J3T6_9FIRM|nr:hypothetical protein [Candidatus Onthousia excrementipullorum]
MKKILCLLIICLLVYTIYYFNHTDKITYISIGDSLSVGIDSNGNTNYGYSNYLSNYLKDKDLLKSYNNYFSTSGTRIVDLENKLETNWTIKKDGKSLSLKKCLREAELVTLSVGMDDILTELTLSTVTVENLSNKEITTIVDKIIEELDALFKELRKYAKEDIIFIGFYNPLEEESLTTERLYTYLITKTKALCKTYDIEYLDIYNLFKRNKNYIDNPTNIYPTTEAYQMIATKIIEDYL